LRERLISPTMQQATVRIAVNVGSAVSSQRFVKGST
jgi:hypothetical protein